MTTVDMTLHWPAAEDWTGFLLVIVPVGRVSAFGAELRKRVRAQIETDPVLYDLVTVTVMPPFAPSPEWDRAFLTGVIETATPDRHFFAPRGAIGVVVVGGRQRTLDKVVDDLRRFPALSRLGGCLFDVEVRAEPDTGVSPESVREVARTVNDLIALYDERPQIALPEQVFLHRVEELTGEYELPLRLSRPQLTKSRSPERALPAAPATPERTLPATPATPERTLPAAPAGDRDPEPVLVEPPPPNLPIARASNLQVAPVVYDGADIVTVDQRTPMQRLTRKNPTDADSIDELRLDGRAVGLAYLVFVPDDGVVPRPTAKRRNAIALELDELLGSVRVDAMSGEEAHVAVEVFSATDPVRKHGILRVAGDLTEPALPRVEIEYFSLSTTVDPLLDAARRTSRALRARGVDAVSIHVIFLAAMRFPADETTEHDWMRLLMQARVTWVDFSPSDRREPMDWMPVTPFGLHVLTAKEDVVAVIRKESEVVYRYTPEHLPVPAQPSPPTAEEQPEPAAPPGSRRWWRFGRSGTE